MAMWTWCFGDPRPTLTVAPAMRAVAEQDVEVLVGLSSLVELDAVFELPLADRDLCAFVTLPVWRGRSVDPRLLRGIVREDSVAAQRFWIINAPENAASAAWIANVAFRPVCELSFFVDHGVRSRPYGAGERARLGAALVRVPLSETSPGGYMHSPCSRCVLAAKQSPPGEVSCWPRQAEGTPGCTCGAANRGTILD